MIAIDTNVLLRYLLLDDHAQARKAEALINGRGTVLVTDAVLVETLWTLAGEKYKLTKNQLIEVVESLFKESNIRFEDGQAVWGALHDYREANPRKISGKKKDADFADALIVNKAKAHAIYIGEKFNGAFTFDVAAQQLPDMHPA